jgi:hypothetical protein
MSNHPYSRDEPFVLTDKMRRQIRGAVAEIDLAQMAIIRKMTPAERVARGADMCAAAEKVGVFRLRLRQPELSEDEAYRIVRGGLLNYYKAQHKDRSWWQKSESDS